ncbi:unnamed protein product, partial [Chrysoparadoxa australica]
MSSTRLATAAQRGLEGQTGDLIIALMEPARQRLRGFQVFMGKNGQATTARMVLSLPCKSAAPLLAAPAPQQPIPPLSPSHTGLKRAPLPSDMLVQETDGSLGLYMGTQRIVPVSWNKGSVTGLSPGVDDTVQIHIRNGDIWRAKVSLYAASHFVQEVLSALAEVLPQGLALALMVDVKRLSLYLAGNDNCEWEAFKIVLGYLLGVRDEGSVRSSAWIKLMQSPYHHNYHGKNSLLSAGLGDGNSSGGPMGTSPSTAVAASKSAVLSSLLSIPDHLLQHLPGVV